MNEDLKKKELSGCSLCNVWCVIPVYNNGKTVLNIALAARRHLKNVLVVDDGSNDVNIEDLLADHDIKVLSFPVNRGKGAVILSALEYIRKKGANWMICLDADGQHNPDDLPLFFSKIDNTPSSIIVGARDFSVPNIPQGSRFGRKFSNFWIKLECGATVSDSQSGFRAYPVELLSQMKFRGNHYDFEVEVLTKAVWYGLSIKEVPISVFYPPKGERISHFDQWKDNLLLTHRHGMLMIRRMLPWPHPKLIKHGMNDWKSMMRHPHVFVMMLLNESATPLQIGLAAGVGVFLGTLPLAFAHTVSILYVSTKLKLNRLLALNVQHLCAPPLVPLVCIQVGFFIRNGSWIGSAELRTIRADLYQYIFDWFIGSIVMAPILALVVGLIGYSIANFMQQKRRIRCA